MGPLDAIWHLLNFFGPAVGVGLLLPLLAKVVWRQALRGLPLMHLVRRTTMFSAFAWVVALVVFGRDGRIASYGALVVASAAGLWWAGFGTRGR